jgi:hypothetical protein
MSLLDKASLIVTPNAYKESKLYSVVPNTTLGDMDVVRATTATRVNSSGLIEVVPRNLVTYSNTFTNAAWVKTNSTIEANSIISPDGTLNASKLNVLAVTYSGLYEIGNSQSNKYTMSLYAKKGNKDWLYFVNLSGSSVVAWFNISNGTLGTVTNGTASITDVGNGWYRCVYSDTNNIANNYFQIGLSDANNSNTPSSSGFSYIWAAQLEVGSTATEYFPTTTRLNIPRIDYTNGSCPSLLVEPQRTNLTTYSEDFTDASWIKTATVSANTTISPSGVQNADTFTDSTNAFLDVRKVLTITANSTNTASFFVKKTTGALTNYPGVAILLTGVATRVDYGIINTTTGAVIRDSSSNINSITYSTQSYGDYWRVIATFTDNQSNLVCTFILYPAISINGTSINSNAQGSNVFWGSQFEVGAYPTSYIPTVASSVTRNADVISKTGISSLIGQTEGTIFLEADIQKRNASDFYIGISNGYSLGEAIYLNQPSSGNLNVLFRTGVLTPTISILSANWNAGNNKIAIAYNSTLGEVFINGVSKGTVALTAVPTCNQIALASRTDSPGGLIGAGPYKQAILFKTRLTNTELAQLTTL